jgi:type II secretory pathway predicted ATPase ExeA
MNEDKFCVTWIYCDYQDADLQTPLNMLGALLRQAVIRLSLSRMLSHNLIHELLRRKRERIQMSLKETLQFLKKVLKQFERSFVCIDALDECKDETGRDLLKSLKILADELSFDGHSVRIFITGRNHVESPITRYLMEEAGNTPTTIPLEANSSDIEKYVLHEIENDVNDVPMDIDFKEKLVSKIISSSGGMSLGSTPL